MIDVNIDYLGLRIPTYSDQYSRIPHFTNNKNDQFICTASFKDEYMREYLDNISDDTADTDIKLSRSLENMLPAFFVYEFDSIPIVEQKRICKSTLANPKCFNRIFSQTFSGSKSIHTLVPIDQELREDIAQDFKFYWLRVAESIYGKDIASMLDPACASIGRLSRNPNGYRDNGVWQECYYFNPNATILNWGLENRIKERKEKIKANRLSKLIENQSQTKLWKESVQDEYAKIEKLHNTGKMSESFNLAYDVIVNHNCPKGANYISGAASLKGCGFGESFVREMLEIASSAHPTNIPKHSIETTLRRLYKN